MMNPQVAGPTMLSRAGITEEKRLIDRARCLAAQSELEKVKAWTIIGVGYAHNLGGSWDHWTLEVNQDYKEKHGGQHSGAYHPFKISDNLQQGERQKACHQECE
jgi:hypothetical protein